jgi:ferredoxin-like protein FixX
MRVQQQSCGVNHSVEVLRHRRESLISTFQVGDSEDDDVQGREIQWMAHAVRSPCYVTRQARSVVEKEEACFELGTMEVVGDDVQAGLSLTVSARC